MRRRVDLGEDGPRVPYVRRPEAMYTDHFHFRLPPFSISPDPRFLYLSDRHREGLAHLLYGVGEGGGFVQLTGEVGTGKTTLCRHLLEEVPRAVDVALVLNPRLTAAELVASVCDELGVTRTPGATSLKVLIDALNRHLLEAHRAGRRSVLVIDEAQDLGVDALEQVRLLTNLETPTAKLLQIILIGQPELKTLLARTDLRQLAQRITARYHLEPLTRGETEAYIRHRLGVAGGSRNLFTRRALARVHRLTGGVPRLINVVCDRALLGAYASGKDRVGGALVRRAAAEVRGEKRAGRGAWAWAAVFGCILATVVGWQVAPESIRGEVRMLLGVTKSEKPSSSRAGAEPVPIPAAPPPTVVSDPPEPLPDPEPSLAERLEKVVDGDTLAEVIPTLVERWTGERPAPGTPATACAPAEAAGLACMKRRGNWRRLLSYDRPAALELFDENGRAHWVVLGSVTPAGEAALEVDGEPLSTTPDEIGSVWLGRYLVLWRPPPLAAPFVGPESPDVDVGWLVAALDHVDGPTEGPSAGRVEYDADIRARIARFQETRGLRPDGLAGAETLIRLNTVLGDPPRLRVGDP